VTAEGAALLGLAGFGTAVGFVPWLIAKAGWGRLARLYRWDGPRPKACTLFGYGVFNGWIGYKHCLIVAVDEKALYLSLWKPFSLFHPPLRIPWERLVRVEDRRILWLRWPQVGFKEVPELKLTLKAATFACLGGRLG
jgi:hypothetical protein